MREHLNDVFIAMMDANEDVHSADWETFLEEFNLVDVHRHCHRDRCPPTYSRGSTKLDHILVSSQLLPAVVRSGILPYHDGIHSTHRGLFVDFNLKQLLNQEFSPVPPMSARLLKMDQIKKVERYQKTMLKHLKNQNVLSCIRRL